VKRFASLGSVLLLALLLVGCKKTPPPVVEAEGTVTLDGQPLPAAYVQFIPDLKDFGAELNSGAVTDDQGHFSLTCITGAQPGAVVTKHHVIVLEATPEDMRGMDERSQEKLAAYRARLKNRPIPDVYASLSKTPLLVEVKADQKVYDLKLTRSPKK
jgi:hypothetical protein